MNINKNTYVYAGIGLFFLLVYLNSSKNVQLVEVGTERNTASFSSDMIPFTLRPPMRLSENEPLPVNKYLRKTTSLNGVNFMPRFEF